MNQGEYLPDVQQPKTEDPHNYIPHQSTRYKNVILGSNGKAQVTKFSKGLDGTFVSTLVETDKQLPHLYDNRSDCCGCTACYAICPVRGLLVNGGMDSIGEIGEQYSFPHGAIYMEEDEEGFKYPVIDASLCIRCYKCVDVCPTRIADKEKGIKFEIWGSKK